ncbi:MAG: DNA-directed RNA polymerase [Acidilobus sp.]|uniref:DNA-directed RNA polymerase n=1 Tax=Acidilobus sp. 7A TaxID=1577685 RepID=UPI000764E766|nr:DNA-directed RNA polymerase [Acidilobus sp. 7A]AMD30968.1 DNA-directed RNA polymerase subunit E [Acidilobus sp. 7A]
MYAEYTLYEWVGVRPELAFSGEIKKAVLQSLREELEGQVDESMGVIISVIDAEVEGDGVLLPNDPQIYFPVRYRVLSFEPILQEVDKGVVSDVREFGAFVSLGPADGFIHRTQLMDEDVDFVQELRAFKGRDSGRTVGVNDAVRVRVTQVSRVSRRMAAVRIGLTMRQPYLGKEEWYEAKPQAVNEGGGKS